MASRAPGSSWTASLDSCSLRPAGCSTASSPASNLVDGGPRPIEAGLGPLQSLGDQRQHGVGGVFDQNARLLLLSLGERTQYEVDILPSAGWAADPDAHTIEVRRPEGLHERVQPVVAGGASPPLDPERSEGEIDVVVAGNDTVHGDAALARKRSDRRAA